MLDRSEASGEGIDSDLLLFPGSFRISVWDGRESVSKEQYQDRSYKNSGNNNRIADISLFGNRESIPLSE